MKITVVVSPKHNNVVEVKWTAAGDTHYQTGSFEMSTAGLRSAIGRPVTELTFEVTISYDSNGASPASLDTASRVLVRTAQALVTQVLATAELHSLPDLPSDSDVPTPPSSASSNPEARA